MNIRHWAVALGSAVVLMGPITASNAAGGQIGTISAVGTATSAGVWDGYFWYRYTYDVSWKDFDHGLSHLGLLQLTGCAEDDHLYRFPVDRGEAKDGESTGEDWEAGDPVTFTIDYLGELIRTGGDPSVPDTVSPDDQPVVKYEPMAGQADEPGKEGEGRFEYFANILPTTGTLTVHAYAKHSSDYAVGDLIGQYPSCTITPDPATLGFLALGGLGLTLKRRRKQ